MEVFDLTYRDRLLIAGTFAGYLRALEKACRDLGGEPEEPAASADLFMKFQALPGVPST